VWFQEIADLETRNSEQLLNSLAKSPELTQVRLMPSLLIPEWRTVPYLREAAPDSRRTCFWYMTPA